MLLPELFSSTCKIIKKLVKILVKIHAECERDQKEFIKFDKFLWKFISTKIIWIIIILYNSVVYWFNYGRLWMVSCRRQLDTNQHQIEFISQPIARRIWFSYRMLKIRYFREQNLIFWWKGKFSTFTLHVNFLFVIVKIIEMPLLSLLNSHANYHWYVFISKSMSGGNNSLYSHVELTIFWSWR